MKMYKFLFYDNNTHIYILYYYRLNCLNSYILFEQQDLLNGI
jgi:hypothetical protein